MKVLHWEDERHAVWKVPHSGGVMVENKKTGETQWPTKYPDGRVAYDNAARVPQRVQKKVSNAFPDRSHLFNDRRAPGGG